MSAISFYQTRRIGRMAINWRDVAEKYGLTLNQFRAEVFNEISGIRV